MHRSFIASLLGCILLLVLMLLLPHHSIAQIQQFIETVPSGKIPKTPEMDTYLARLKKNPNLSGYHFITLNPLATSQKDGILKLNIPGKNKTIVAEASEVKYHSATDYEWIGKTDENRGTIIILSKAGSVTAHFSTPDGVYEIFPAPGNLYCLHVIDLSKGDDVGCVTTGEKSIGGRIATEEFEQTFPPDSNAKMNPCQPLISPRVLVLFTPKALALAGSAATVKDQADLCVAQFNSCIYNSGILSSAVLTLAGVEQINFVETKDQMVGDVNKLINNATAQNLRNQYQADLVVLFTDGDYGARGVTASPIFTNATAYSIVQILNAITNKTFAHEVGHIYGCRHDGHDGSPQFAQGYNIKNALGMVKDRTLMSTNTADGSNRLLNFSNPNINADGKPTGTAANNNNAQRIIDTHVTVSNFRPNPPDQLVAYVDGPTFITAPGTKSYELTYSCGSPPYSIVWHYSYDGVNYLPSSVTTDIFPWSFYQTQKIWIRGTIIANGKSLSAFIAITAQMPNPYKLGVLQADSVSQNASALEVAPNPASNEVGISYNVTSDADLKIEILNYSGLVIEVLIDDREQRKVKGNFRQTWDAGNYASGVYFAKLTVGQRIETRRILIVK